MTVTMGIISATKKSELGVLDLEGSYENFIQTDAAINRGNSGGPLLDAVGRLIGINTAIISQTGASMGIGLAIPVNMVQKVLTDLVERGGVRRGFLGVELAPSSDGTGVIVTKIVTGKCGRSRRLRTKRSNYKGGLTSRLTRSINRGWQSLKLHRAQRSRSKLSRRRKEKNITCDASI